MSQFIHTKLGEDRRLAIPAKLCNRLGIHAGDPVVLEEDNGSLRLIPYSQVLAEVQAAFAPYRRPGVSEVDALIADRKAEFEREEAKFNSRDSRKPRD